MSNQNVTLRYDGNAYVDSPRFSPSEFARIKGHVSRVQNCSTVLIMVDKFTDDAGEHTELGQPSSFIVFPYPSQEGTMPPIETYGDQETHVWMRAYIGRQGYVEGGITFTDGTGADITSAEYTPPA